MWLGARLKLAGEVYLAHLLISTEIQVNSSNLSWIEIDIGKMDSKIVRSNAKKIVKLRIAKAVVRYETKPLTRSTDRDVLDGDTTQYAQWGEHLNDDVS